MRGEGLKARSQFLVVVLWSPVKLRQDGRTGSSYPEIATIGEGMGDLYSFNTTIQFQNELKVPDS